MKRFGSMAAVFLAAIGSVSAVSWYDSFDDRPLGSITNNAGWESTKGEVNADGTVITTRPWSSPQVLSLPAVGIGSDMKIAVYTNVAFTFSDKTGLVVHVGAKLYRANRDQYVSFHLGQDGSNRLSVSTDLDGTIKLGTNDSDVLFVTGRYARVDFWYHYRENRMALYYDSTNTLLWTNYGSAAFTEFNNFWIQRAKIGALDSGAVYVDDVVVETFHPALWGWWRYESDPADKMIDYANHFQPYDFDSRGDEPIDASWPSLWTGSGVVGNRNAFYNPIGSVPLVTMRSGPTTNNWTLEWIGGSTYTNYDPYVFSFGDYNFESFIRVIWRTDSSRLEVTMQGGSAPFSYTTYHNCGRLPADSNWHHVALVKTGAVMKTYVDYRLVTNTSLTGSSADDYWIWSKGPSLPLFPSEFGHGFMDEIRFTWAELKTNDFLQLDCPEVVGALRRSDNGQLVFRAATRPAQTYRYLMNSNLATNPVWTFYRSQVATQFYSDVQFSFPAGYENAVFRMEKE